MGANGGAPRDRQAPPKAGPDAGDNPGYAEDLPRDRDDVRAPHGRDDPPSPDEGGLQRDPDDSDDDNDDDSGD